MLQRQKQKNTDDAKDAAVLPTEKQEVVEQPEYPLVQEEAIVVAITDRRTATES